MRKCPHRVAWIATDHPFLTALGAWLDEDCGTAVSPAPVYQTSPIPVPPSIPGFGALADVDPWRVFSRTNLSDTARHAFGCAAPAYRTGLPDVVGPLALWHR